MLNYENINLCKIKKNKKIILDMYLIIIIFCRNYVIYGYKWEKKFCFILF